MTRLGFLILNDGADLEGLASDLRLATRPGDAIHISEVARQGHPTTAPDLDWGPGVHCALRRVSGHVLQDPLRLVTLMVDECQADWALILRGQSILHLPQIDWLRRQVADGASPDLPSDTLINMADYRSRKGNWSCEENRLRRLFTKECGSKFLPETKESNLVTNCCVRDFSEISSCDKQPSGNKPYSAPALLGRARLLVAAVGPHAHRQPFAYASLRPLWEERISLTPDAHAADIVCFAHPEDARIWPHLADLSTQKPVAILSEEPFWDSLFSPDPSAPQIVLPSCEGKVPLWQINHHRSAIFDFAKIPYLLLTDHRAGPRLAAKFSRNAGRTPQDWQSDFQARAESVVFMAARREESFHDVTPQDGVFGLSRWRSRLAAACPGALKFGSGWNDGPDRRHLPDWHLDKLTRMDGRTRILSAIENTHQPTYLSEKLFDAFACGARPLYVAGPSHGIHRLNLPAASWINLWGLDLRDAIQRIQTEPLDFSAYAQAQRQLATLFADPANWLAERARLKRALLSEMLALADKGPAVSARLPHIP
jgi:hypothetical protein